MQGSCGGGGFHLQSQTNSLQVTLLSEYSAGTLQQLWTCCFNNPSCSQILKSTFAKQQGQSKALQKNLSSPGNLLGSLRGWAGQIFS